MERRVLVAIPLLLSLLLLAEVSFAGPRGKSSQSKSSHPQAGTSTSTSDDGEDILFSGTIGLPPEVVEQLAKGEYTTAITKAKRIRIRTTTEIKSTESSRSHYDSEIKKKNEEILRLERTKGAAQTKLDQEANEALGQQRKREQQLIAQLRAESERLASNLDQKRRIELSDLDAQLGELKQARTELERLRDSVQNYLLALQSQFESIDIQFLMDRAQEISSNKEALIKFNRELKSISDSVNNDESDLANKLKLKESYSDSINALSEKYKKQADARRRETEKELAELKEMVEKKKRELADIPTIIGKEENKSRELYSNLLSKSAADAEAIITKKQQSMDKQVDIQQQLQDTTSRQAHLESLLARSIKTNHALSEDSDDVIADMEELTKRRPPRCTPKCLFFCIQKIWSYDPWLTQHIKLNGEDTRSISFIPKTIGTWLTSEAISDKIIITPSDGISREVYVEQINMPSDEDSVHFRGVTYTVYATPHGLYDLPDIQKKHGLFRIHIDHPASGAKINGATRPLTVTISPLNASISDEYKYQLPAPKTLPGEAVQALSENNATSSAQHRKSTLPLLTNKPGMKQIKSNGFLPVLNMQSIAVMAQQYIEAEPNSEDGPESLLKHWKSKKQLSVKGEEGGTTHHHLLDWALKSDDNYFFNKSGEKPWRPMSFSASRSATGFTLTETGIHQQFPLNKESPVIPSSAE